MNGAAPVQQVICWDIDGTLLTTARAGVFALEEAARALLGRAPDFSALPTAGLTDAEVAALAIRTCGGDASPRNVADFLSSYESWLPSRLPWREGRVLPGVLEVLDDLAGRDEVACLLLTGNTEAGAAAKLGHYGLSGRFTGGAFCTGMDDREAIARRAEELARERFGDHVTGDRLVVVGDTPHDVRCGQAIGARTVAVASGPVDLETLKDAAAWRTFASLPAPAVFAEAIGLAPVAGSEREPTP